jgi:hypothetical protein
MTDSACMAEMPLPFQRTQYAFAAAIRDPGSCETVADVPAARMDVYRELIYRNIESFLSGGFPVLSVLLDAGRWEAMVRDFLVRHHSTTPYFSGIPAEFLSYLTNERGDQPSDPPFLVELAHYEWVELALSVSEGEAPAECAELLADPLACCIAVSDIAWPLVYRFPVHRIGPDFQPTTAPSEPTCLVVYRDRSDRVRFLEVNPATFRLLQCVEDDPGRPALRYLEQIAADLGSVSGSQVLEYGAVLLRTLAERSIIGVPLRESRDRGSVPFSSFRA